MSLRNIGTIGADFRSEDDRPRVSNNPADHLALALAESASQDVTLGWTREERLRTASDAWLTAASDEDD